MKLRSALSNLELYAIIEASNVMQAGGSSRCLKLHFRSGVFKPLSSLTVIRLQPNLIARDQILSECQNPIVGTKQDSHTPLKAGRYEFRLCQFSKLIRFHPTIAARKVVILLISRRSMAFTRQFHILILYSRNQALVVSAREVSQTRVGTIVAAMTSRSVFTHDGTMGRRIVNPEPLNSC